MTGQELIDQYLELIGQLADRLNAAKDALTSSENSLTGAKYAFQNHINYINGASSSNLSIPETPNANGKYIDGSFGVPPMSMSVIAGLVQLEETYRAAVNDYGVEYQKYMKVKNEYDQDVPKYEAFIAEINKGTAQGLAQGLSPGQADAQAAASFKVQQSNEALKGVIVKVAIGFGVVVGLVLLYVGYKKLTAK